MLSQGPSTENPPKCRDAVDALANRLNLREIGQFRRFEFFLCAEIAGRLQVAQATGPG